MPAPTPMARWGRGWASSPVGHAIARASAPTEGGRVALAQSDLGAIALYHGADDPWARVAPYALGVLALEDFDLPTAQSQFAAVHHGDVEASVPLLHARAGELSTAAASPLPRKSPWLAAGLSLAPGLGQLYAGHRGDAAIAFLFNAGFGAGATFLLVDGIQQGRGWEIGAGAALAGLFSISYPANLLGAYRGAHRTNRHHERRRAEELLQQAWAPELELAAEEVELP